MTAHGPRQVESEAAFLDRLSQIRADAEARQVARGLPCPGSPTRADLDAATAATAAAIADRTASLAEVERLAEAEAAIYDACPDYPALYDPEAETEAEI